jgi:hypothetical protein
MRISTCFGFVVLCSFGVIGATCQAQSQPNSVALRPASPAPTQAGSKSTFLLFSRGDSAKTQRVAAELGTALATRSDRAQWQLIDVTAPVHQELVNRYQLSRAPMPLVLCIAPNGTVTGAMPGRVTEKAVEASLVTPTMTRCMKWLQAGKIVVVHIKASATDTLPAGAAGLLADPAFQNRTVMESFVVSDPAEDRFLRDMEINPADASGSALEVLAPPGMLVGKFPSTATTADIAAQLHAAGKCCNDPNCKHNKKGQ